MREIALHLLDIAENSVAANARSINLKVCEDMHCDRLTASVSDDGKGMDEGTIQKVFEPFFTTKRSHGGTGLGMHLVYNLVTQTMGGIIECYSNQGRGVEFRISFPIPK